MAKNSLKYAGNLTLNAAIFELPVFLEAKKLVMENVGPLTTQIGRVCYPHQSNFYGIWYMVYGFYFFGSNNQFHCGYRCLEGKGTYVIEMRNYGQLADGPTRRRIKSSRDVGELVVNPIQLIRS